MVIVIPEGSIEIQTGLWAHNRQFTFDGIFYSVYDLYSAEGYCFWEVNQPENYDEEGNLKPPVERVYSRIAYTPYETIEELNENFISVPIEPGFEITSGENEEII